MDFSDLGLVCMKLLTSHSLLSRERETSRSVSVGSVDGCNNCSELNTERVEMLGQQLQGYFLVCLSVLIC